VTLTAAFPQRAIDSRRGRGFVYCSGGTAYTFLAWTKRKTSKSPVGRIWPETTSYWAFEATTQHFFTFFSLFAKINSPHKIAKLYIYRVLRVYCSKWVQSIFKKL
jgi:hypothetical protein